MSYDYYEEKLTPKRLFDSKIRDSDFEHFFSDRSRILFSPYFRALQQKTQVFPLEMNRTVRTRLIHSLEVMNTGSQLARHIANALVVKRLLRKTSIDSFICIVENACLMHDIGNPPFGHFGETAIKTWFHENCDNYAKEAGVLPKKDNQELKTYKNKIKDFTKFDGNQQTIRIITKLRPDQYGIPMNLTYQTILSAIKYPKSNGEIIGEEKAGYFITEESYISKMLSDLNIEQNSRYPLSYIVEAADDISYCMSDIDDGIEKKLITHDGFVKEIKKEWFNIKNNVPVSIPDEFHIYNSSEVEDSEIPVDLPNKKREPFNYGRDLASKWTLYLTQKVSEMYLMNDIHKEIMTGRLNELIPEDSDCGTLLEALKSLSKKKLYLADEVINLELAGLEIIGGLLNHFCKLLFLTKDNFAKILSSRDKSFDIERRIYGKIGERFKRVYKTEIINTACKKSNFESCFKKIDDLDEWILRAHMIIDHISAMTDDYALTQYKYLKGVLTV